MTEVRNQPALDAITKARLAVVIRAARNIIGPDRPTSPAYESDIDLHNWIEAYHANPSHETAVGLAFRGFEYFGGLLEMRGRDIDPEDDEPGDRKARLAARAALVDLGLIRRQPKVMATKPKRTKLAQKRRRAK